jgi:predicted dehydrogenase
MAMNAAELDALDGVSGKVLIMEAFMVRHSLQWNAARDLIRAGEIGRVRMIQSYFCYDNRDPANIRNRPEYGGGALMDIGCYPAVAGRFFFGADPVRATSLVERSPDFGTDIVTSGLVDFGGGRQLTFAVSTQLAPAQSLTIFGDKGRLNIQVPYNAQTDAPNVFTIDDGRTLDGGSARRYVMEVSDQYTRMAEDFSRALLGEISLPYGLDDARANMRVIDALFRSEKSGAWEKIGE